MSDPTIIHRVTARSNSGSFIAPVYYLLPLEYDEFSFRGRLNTLHPTASAVAGFTMGGFAVEISYPMSAADVEYFVDRNRKRYLIALENVRELIWQGKRETDELRCIYNIYSRAEKQGGEEIKHPSKIRMKFNKYCEDHSLPKLNIFDVNDIVGLTISVTYPSDINRVCAYIDELCRSTDRKLQLFPLYFSRVENEKTNEKNMIKIETDFGSVKNDRGYFACHYCLRTNNTPNDPIVEVQIKTVLHDAWGLKTHDLTYKNPFPIDNNTSNCFALLGDALSNLDMQSDFLRRSIRKVHAFREAKKRELQIELTTHGPGCISISDLAFTPLTTEARNYVSILRELAQGSRSLGSNEMINMRKEAISFCTSDSNECSCRLLCALAVITGDTQAQLDALERIDIWSDNEKDNIIPRKQRHVAKFYFGDIGGAIDAAEDTLRYLNNADQNRKEVVDAVDSVLSSLAYYYAELIETDEGNKRSARENAIKHRNASRVCLQKMGFINDPEKDWPQLIDELLSHFKSIDPSDQRRLSDLFNIIDNAIFGEIQTSHDSKTIREALNWLERLVDVRPDALASPAKLSHALHTHCARIRLLEFEAKEASAGAS